MSQYCIAGIDTGVGKTLVTAALAYRTGWPVFKPILSGIGEPGVNDADLLARVTGQTSVEISPWQFAAPLSPHLAAAREGKRIDPPELEAWGQAQLEAHPQLCIEGVGGLMVPLDGQYTMFDWMRAMRLPIILVSSSYLGTINHSLLSIAQLQQHDMPLQAVIVSQAAPERDAGLQDTCETLRAYLPQAVPVIALPRLAPSDTPWKQAADLLNFDL